MQENTLLMFSPVAVPDPEADPLRLPRKHVEGLAMFAELWQGSVTVLLPSANKRDDNLDYISVQRAELSFHIRAVPEDSVTLGALISSAAVVLVPLISRYAQIPALCNACQVPVVVDADLTPGVREEIIRVENKNPLFRWRRLLWQRNMEQNYTAMVRAAQGIHLQGPAAYNFYAPLNPAPLMYFDTRARRAMFLTAAQLEARSERLCGGAPLNLIYSGRWRSIKGVRDLPRVAAELRGLGVHAEWHIFGGGVLEPQLKCDIAGARLDNVRLHGELPFPDLMRFAADQGDLFVCCHRQGDPSTTFIEMMSAGVPLIGYNTEGLRGMVTLSGTGWLTPRDDVPGLAARIAELDRDRDALVEASRQAVEFASSNSFEDMMQRRVDHLRAVTARYKSEFLCKSE